MRKKNLKKLFDSNRFVAVLSLLLAVVCWLVFNMVINPVITKTFNNIPVKIDTTGTAAAAVGLEVITQSVDTVSVTVKGERFTVHSLTENDIEAYASTISVNDKGVYNLSLSARLVNGTSSLEFSAEPSTIAARFDKKESRDFTVHPVVENISVADGYSIGELSVIDGSSITVYGPETELDSIDSVKAVYAPETLQELSQTIYPSAEIKLYNASGEEIDTDLLEIRPSNTCYITVPVMMSKTVNLAVRYANAPSNNFTLPSSISVSRAEIIGQVGTVSDIDYLYLNDISVSEISPSHHVFERTVNFTRVGVSLVDKSIEPVTVTVDMSGYSEKRISVPKDNAHVITGLADGLECNILTTNSVVMVGPSDVIESLNANELYYELDLSDITAPGTYTQNVNVRLLNNTGVWAYGKYSVKISLTSKT